MRKIICLLIFSAALHVAQAQQKVTRAKWRLAEAPDNIAAYDHPFRVVRVGLMAALYPVLYPQMRYQILDIFPIDPKDVFCVIDVWNHDVIYDFSSNKEGFITFYCIERTYANYPVIVVLCDDNQIAENCDEKEVPVKVCGTKAIESMEVTLF